MFCVLWYVCEDSQTTVYMKHVDSSLILIAINATANEFQMLSNQAKTKTNT